MLHSAALCLLLPAAQPAAPRILTVAKADDTVPFATRKLPPSS